AGEGERDRVKALAGRFSREDLLRAFDLLTKAEQEIKSAAQPRYALEMALLRWIHLRKLMPIEDLIACAGVPDKPAARASLPPPPGGLGRPRPRHGFLRQLPLDAPPLQVRQQPRRVRTGPGPIGPRRR